MKKMIFPLITEFDEKLPFYLGGVGCAHIQEYVSRPNGYPYLQWIQCRKGKGELILEGNKYIVEEKQGMLLYPNMRHEYYSIDDMWCVDWISIGGVAAEQLLMHNGLGNSGVFTVQYPELLLQKTQKAYDIATSGSIMKSVECSIVVYDLLLDLVAFAHTSNDNFMMQQYSKLLPVINFIDTNYSRAISLEELSEQAGLTPQYLCTLFKKITGKRVFEYINSVRINNSKMLMIKDKNLGIREISKLCGYEDASYYCAQFKKIEKITPSEFRKIH